MISNDGFSVVAPIRRMLPFSTAAKRHPAAPCRSGRISSTKTMVRVPYWRAPSASLMTCLISLMPASTAENSTKSASVMRAIILASVVLPVPGGPRNHRRGIVALDLNAQRFARADQVFLSYEFIERARTHAVGQRARAARGSSWFGMGANRLIEKVKSQKSNCRSKASGFEYRLFPPYASNFEIYFCILTSDF